MGSNQKNHEINEQSKRVGARRQCIREVSLFDETGQPIVLETIDVGPRGIFVRSDLLLDLGEELWVSLKLPDGPKLVVRGKVVRGQLGSDDLPAGMGIAFVDLTAREETWLRRYIHEETIEQSVWSLVATDAAPTTHQTPGTL